MYSERGVNWRGVVRLGGAWRPNEYKCEMWQMWSGRLLSVGVAMWPGNEGEKAGKDEEKV